MVLQPVKCPVCMVLVLLIHGNTSNGKQRFVCKDQDCENKTFISGLFREKLFTRNE